MALHRTSNQDRGFTLTEILIVVGLIAIIISLGLILSMDFYRTYAFGYERDLIVSLLQQARSRAMANIGELTHGVRYSIGEYIILEGGDPTNKVFEANQSIEITWEEDVIFNQLEGACEDCVPNDIEIEMVGFGKEAVIKINSEGRIDYE